MARRSNGAAPRGFHAASLRADNRGDTERYAAATFLATLGTPPAAVADPPADVIRETVAAGAERFVRTGCALCHEAQGDRPPQVTLKWLGQKTTPAAIETFLQKPDAIAPAGRMPRFVLGKLEKRELAMYLAYKDAESPAPLSLPERPSTDALQDAFAALAQSEAERALFRALSPDEQVKALGRQVMQARNCAACHEIKLPGEAKPWEPTPARHDFLAIAHNPSAGCLSADSPDGAKAPGSPRFSAALDRIAASAFLQAAIVAPALPAPADKCASLWRDPTAWPVTSAMAQAA